MTNQPLTRFLCWIWYPSVGIMDTATYIRRITGKSLTEMRFEVGQKKTMKVE